MFFCNMSRPMKVSNPKPNPMKAHFHPYSTPNQINSFQPQLNFNPTSTKFQLNLISASISTSTLTSLQAQTEINLSLNFNLNSIWL